MDTEELTPEVKKYVESLKTENYTLEADNKKYKAQYDHLLEEFKALLHRKYGRSAEQIEASQQELFSEELF